MKMAGGIFLRWSHCLWQSVFGLDVPTEERTCDGYSGISGSQIIKEPGSVLSGGISMKY